MGIEVASLRLRVGVALLAVTLFHVAWLIWNELSGSVIWVRSPADVTRAAIFFVVGFLCYTAYQLGTLGPWTRASLNVRSIFAKVFQLGLLPGLALCFILPSFLVTHIPGSGENQKTDETITLLISWAMTSSVAYSWARIKTRSSFPSLGEVSPRPRQAVGAGVDQVYSPSVLKNVPKERLIVISQLMARAMQLEKRSGIILVGIIFMLVCAALFIVFAGQITSLDVSGTKLVSLAQSDLRAAEEDLATVASAIRDRTRRLAEAKERAARGAATEPATFDEGSDDVLQLRYLAKKEALAAANAVLLKVRERQFDDDRAKDQTSGQILLLQTSVTRFGVVLIMVFLVQILVNLYRYNMRLSAFYFGRGDALVLLNSSADDLSLGTLVGLISPDKLDFGRAPRTPAEEAGGLIQAWTGRFRSSQDSHSDPKAGKLGKA